MLFQDNLKAVPAVLQLPIGSEAEFVGVIDLVAMTVSTTPAWRFAPHEGYTRVIIYECLNFLYLDNRKNVLLISILTIHPTYKWSKRKTFKNEEGSNRAPHYLRATT